MFSLNDVTLRPSKNGWWATNGPWALVWTLLVYTLEKNAMIAKMCIVKIRLIVGHLEMYCHNFQSSTIGCMCHGGSVCDQRVALQGFSYRSTPVGYHVIRFSVKRTPCPDIVGVNVCV